MNWISKMATSKSNWNRRFLLRRTNSLSTVVLAVKNQIHQAVLASHFPRQVNFSRRLWNRSRSLLQSSNKFRRHPKFSKRTNLKYKSSLSQQLSIATTSKFMKLTIVVKNRFIPRQLQKRIFHNWRRPLSQKDRRGLSWSKKCWKCKNWIRISQLD